MASRRRSTSVGASVGVVRAAATQALTADTNQDGRLDFEEFQAALEQLTTSDAGLDCKPDELRALFNSVDTDSSGMIDTHEFFLWVLDHALSRGCGLQAVFQKYDSDGRGGLDIYEFGRAVEDLGFPSSLSAQVFIELDTDGGGSISCQELVEELHRRARSMSPETKAFLADLALVDVTDGGRLKPPPSGASATGQQAALANLFGGAYRLTATDADALRKQLLSRLLALGLNASHLHAAMLDGKPHLTINVFAAAIGHFGFAGPKEVISKTQSRLELCTN